MHATWHSAWLFRAFIYLCLFIYSAACFQYALQPADCASLPRLRQNIANSTYNPTFDASIALRQIPLKDDAKFIWQYRK